MHNCGLPSLALGRGPRRSSFARQVAPLQPAKAQQFAQTLRDTAPPCKSVRGQTQIVRRHLNKRMVKANCSAASCKWS
eukprot:87673-Pyramimonas_sp.AAC.1